MSNLFTVDVIINGMANKYRGSETVVLDRWGDNYKARVVRAENYPDLPDVKPVGIFPDVDAGFVDAATRAAERIEGGASEHQELKSLRTQSRRAHGSVTVVLDTHRGDYRVKPLSFEGYPDIEGVKPVGLFTGVSMEFLKRADETARRIENGTVGESRAVTILRRLLKEE